MKRLEYLVRQLLSIFVAIIGALVVYQGMETKSAHLIVIGIVLVTGTWVFNIKATHDRLKDIFTGHDMWMVWGGYILLSLIPVVSLVTLAIFVLPSGKFAKKG